METIKENKKFKENKYENAFIEDGYIIPGLNGVKINELDSYYQMVNENTFLENKLVFYQVKPEVSIEDNKNLIIKLFWSICLSLHIYLFILFIKLIANGILIKVIK